jgi:interferon gamma-inducible protein 30
MEAKQSLVRLPLLRWQQLLILLIITSLYANSCSASAAGNALRVPNEEKKVKLELYYETLCPYCARFIVEKLYTIFDTGIIDITDLKLIPYGNAKIRPNGTITCQHGQWECLLNTVEGCAIATWPDVNEHFPYIYCVENLIYQGDYSKWETCFDKLGLDPKPIYDCYENGKGHEIQLGFAAVTNALQPPHKYVPWVTVDGQPLYDDYHEFITFICKAYKGSHTPSACSDLSSTAANGKEGQYAAATSVCYTEAIKSMYSSIVSVVKTWFSGATMVAWA